MGGGGEGGWVATPKSRLKKQFRPGQLLFMNVVFWLVHAVIACLFLISGVHNTGMKLHDIDGDVGETIPCFAEMAEPQWVADPTAPRALTPAAARTPAATSSVTCHTHKTVTTCHCHCHSLSLSQALLSHVHGCHLIGAAETMDLLISYFQYGKGR
jgi:hypothetical protein